MIPPGLRRAVEVAHGTPGRAYHTWDHALAVLAEVERTEGWGDPRAAALAALGYADEDALAAAIRAGELDGRDTEVISCLRELVRHRLAIAHPGYAAQT